MFLYHLAPKIMQGNILYPLNVLKEKFPSIYENEMKKYEGRGNIMSQTIPHLHCLWNDVLHFSAVDPQEIMNALKSTGGNPKPITVFQIPAEDLLGENTIVYLYKQTSPDKKLDPENFKPFKLEDLPKYAILPEETKKYYRETFAKGERPFLFHKVPHVLFKGMLDVTNYQKREI